MTTAEQSPEQKKVFHKFCSNIPSVKYIFKNGKTANFVAGQYLTAIKSEIEELQFEIENGHPHISVDNKELTVDSLHADPLEKIKKQAIEEYLARQAAAVNPENDMGTSVATSTGIMASRAIGSITVGSKSPQK